MECNECKFYRHTVEYDKDAGGIDRFICTYGDKDCENMDGECPFDE